MDPLDKKERESVREFRDRIPDLLPRMGDFQKEDVSLIRWIRARDGNLERAEQMIRKHIMWREENDIDNISDVDLPDFEVDFPLITCGSDKEGFPLCVVNIGLWDIREAVEAGKRDEFGTYIIKYFENILKANEHYTTEDKVITQIFIVADFEEFSFRQLASKEVIQLVLELVSIFEDQYPEILRAVYVINAPKIFQILWAMIKPLLTKRTLAKVNIIGGNKEAWKTELKKRIDVESNFPSAYGGGILTLRDYKFEHGVDVFSPSTIEIFGEKEMTTVQIGPGMTHEVTLNLGKGSKLTWNFRTENCDIGFSLHRGKQTAVVKYCRVDSHLVLQRGEVICEESGIYTFKFDNSYSTFRGKILKLCIRATAPEEHHQERIY